jgi:hypothetical protein
MMDLMPLWPLWLNLNLLGAAFLLYPDIAELVFEVVVDNDEMIFEDLLNRFSFVVGRVFTVKEGSIFCNK